MDIERWEKHWKDFIAEQKIEIEGKRATVTFETFEKLDDYSCTLPSGVILGKVWRRREPYRGRHLWWFMQYTEHPDPTRVFITARELYVRDPRTPEQPRRASERIVRSIRWHLETTRKAAAVAEALA